MGFAVGPRVETGGTRRRRRADAGRVHRHSRRRAGSRSSRTARTNSRSPRRRRAGAPSDDARSPRQVWVHPLRERWTRSVEQEPRTHTRSARARRPSTIPALRVGCSSGTHYRAPINYTQRALEDRGRPFSCTDPGRRQVAATERADAAAVFGAANRRAGSPPSELQLAVDVRAAVDAALADGIAQHPARRRVPAPPRREDPQRSASTLVAKKRAGADAWRSPASRVEDAPSAVGLPSNPDRMA